MSVTIERSSGSQACVVHLGGDVDIAAVPEIRDAIDTVVTSGCTRVVLDLADVAYADSSALGLLVWIDRRLNATGGRVVLAAADRNVSRVLELSGLVGVAPSLSTASDVDEALGGLGIPPVRTDPKWEKTLRVPARADELSRMRTRVCELVEPLGLTESCLFDMKVAVGEALANAVRHGSPSSRAQVAVTVSAYEDRVVVAVRDRGRGFDGSAALGNDVYASGGRGIQFMHALADVVEFSRSEDGGTIVRLTKCLPVNAPDEVVGDRT